MITSNLSRAGHASRVEILRAAAEERQSGLLTDSVVMTDNLATVTHTEIHRGWFMGLLLSDHKKEPCKYGRSLHAYRPGSLLGWDRIGSGTVSF